MKHLFQLFISFLFSTLLFSQEDCISERSIYTILINTYDQLFVEMEVMDITELKDAVKMFVSNPDDVPGLSLKREEKIPLLGKMMVSKGIISIQCDRNTTYQKYIDVQNEVEKAYNELRNELALEQFKTPYKKLNKEKRRAINKAIPKRISEAAPRKVRK